MGAVMPSPTVLSDAEFDPEHRHEPDDAELSTALPEDPSESDEELPSTVLADAENGPRGRKRKASTTTSPGISVNSSRDSTERTITYHLKIATASELDKAPVKRNNKARIAKKSQNLSFLDFQNEITKIATDVLKLPYIMTPYDDFDVMFTVPRKVPDPCPLQSPEDYDTLLDSVKSAKDPTASLFMCQLKKPTKRAKKNRSKENHSTGSSTESGSEGDSEDSDGNVKTRKGKSKKDKKKKKKEKPTLEDDVIAKTKLLRERWQCSVNDGSDHCYFTPDEPKHVPLSHSHFRVWAQALLKHDDELATVEKPPNHHIFNDLPKHARGANSPLLQRRLQNIKTTSEPTSTMPVFHIHIPGSGGGTGSSSSPSRAPEPTSVSEKLVPHGNIGPDMSIEEFCISYDIHGTVLDRLKDNGYYRSKALKYITELQLKEMGFKHGDIASLREAAEAWSEGK
ncbi:hypothetical protein H0H93_008104 [Arthromyces matolae]|nr:hypothetical protein H0H93_008104 [Arthromyces matolae]